MARRRFQSGSLKDDGDRWILRWREDVIDASGNTKRIRKWEWLSKKEYPTQKLAHRELDRRVSEVNREDYRPTSTVTFKVFAQKWQTSVLIHHKPSAQASYGSVIRVHLKPDFDDLPLRDITTEFLQAWVSSHPASPNTIRNNIVIVLKAMWAKARAWGYVTHDPFQGLVLPRKVEAKTYSFSMEETVAIIERAAEPWKTLFRIVAETGVRSGEVAGLRVEDFDPINLTLSVRQSVWNRKIQTPKSSKAVRREPISSELAYAIGEVIKSSEPNVDRLIFTNQGKPLQMIHFLRLVFRPILEELGIRKKVKAMGIKQCGLHALRRMNCTQMDEQGVPLRTRQDRAGHSHPSTTLIHYTKPIDEASRRFADRMGAMLAPKKDDQAVQ